MEQIYGSLIGLITPGLIAGASKSLNENESAVGQAASCIFAGFLALIQRHGDSLRIRCLLDSAASRNIFSETIPVRMNGQIPEQLSIGNNFLQHMLGASATGFTASISSETGLSRPVVDKMAAFLAPVFVGYIGEKLMKEKWSMHKLLGVISIQKSTFREYIPGIR